MVPSDGLDRSTGNKDFCKASDSLPFIERMIDVSHSTIPLYIDLLVHDRNWLVKASLCPFVLGHYVRWTPSNGP